MCMKNLNVNAITFNKVSNDTFPLLPFDRITARNEGDTAFVDDFNVLICTNIVLSVKSDENPIECMVKDNTYDFLIRLTHLKTNRAVDISKYSLTLNDATIHTVCRPIYEGRKIISYSKLEIPNGSGQYAIKVYVKNRQETDKWYLQTIQTFWVDC